MKKRFALLLLLPTFGCLLGGCDAKATLKTAKEKVIGGMQTAEKWLDEYFKEEPVPTGTAVKLSYHK